jgi:hypothetical protein
MEVTHLGCATVHQLIASFLLVDPEVKPVRHIAHNIDRLGLEPSLSPLLIEHRLSHFAQGSIFSFHHANLRRGIWTQKLVFKTQVMEKVSK